MPTQHLKQTEIKEFLESHNLAPQKQFGQNFLIDSNLLRIVFEAGVPYLSKNVKVAEIGIGLGSLTRFLLELPNDLHLFEIDRAFIEHAKETYLQNHSNVILHEGDARLHLPNLFEETLFVYGNLPYHLTSELITIVIQKCTSLVGAAFVVQKEFAERITNQISSLSVFLSAFGKVELLRTLHRKSFYPTPKVDSSLIRFTPSNNRNALFQTERDIEVWSLLLRSLFWGKRKQMKVSLKESPFSQENLEFQKAVWIASESTQISLLKRPEELERTDFQNLFREILANFPEPV